MRPTPRLKLNRRHGYKRGHRVEVVCRDPHPLFAFDWRPGTVKFAGLASITVTLDEPVVMPPPMRTFREWLVFDDASIRRTEATT